MSPTDRVSRFFSGSHLKTKGFFDESIHAPTQPPRLPRHPHDRRGLFDERGAVRRAARPHTGARGRPVYPDRLPLDTDNDLIIINDKITPAVGEITRLTGRVLDASGSPIRGEGRDLAVRRQGRLPSQCRQRPESGAAGRQFPGLRPVPDRLDRRVSLSHDQADPVPGTAGSAHPLQDQEG